MVISSSADEVLYSSIGVAQHRRDDQAGDLADVVEGGSNRVGLGEIEADAAGAIAQLAGDGGRTLVIAAGDGHRAAVLRAMSRHNPLVPPTISTDPSAM